MMELSQKDKTIKYLVYCLLLLLAALLQNVGGLFLEIGRARCFLLLPVCVLLGINEDERAAALLGLFAGFLWDMVSVQHRGFNCIFLMLVCYLISALVTFVFRNTFLVGVIASAAAVVLYCVLYWLLFVVIGTGEGRGASFLYFYLPCAVYTCAVTPLIYWILSPLQTKLNKEPVLD